MVAIRVPSVVLESATHLYRGWSAATAPWTVRTRLPLPLFGIFVATAAPR